MFLYIKCIALISYHTPPPNFIILQFLPQPLFTPLRMYRDCYSYGIGYQQGYQKTGPVQSTVTTKLKGAWRYNGSYGDYTHNCGGYVGNTTFDEADYVIPPQVKINLLHMYC